LKVVMHEVSADDTCAWATPTTHANTTPAMAAAATSRVPPFVTFWSPARSLPFPHAECPRKKLHTISPPKRPLASRGQQKNALMTAALPTVPGAYEVEKVGSVAGGCGEASERRRRAVNAPPDARHAPAPDSSMRRSTRDAVAWQLRGAHRSDPRAAVFT